MGKNQNLQHGPRRYHLYTPGQNFIDFFSVSCKTHSEKKVFLIYCIRNEAGLLSFKYVKYHDFGQAATVQRQKKQWATFQISDVYLDPEGMK